MDMWSKKMGDHRMRPLRMVGARQGPAEVRKRWSFHLATPLPSVVRSCSSSSSGHAQAGERALGDRLIYEVKVGRRTQGRGEDEGVGGAGGGRTGSESGT